MGSGPAPVPPIVQPPPPPPTPPTAADPSVQSVGQAQRARLASAYGMGFDDTLLTTGFQNISPTKTPGGLSTLTGQ